MAILQFQKLLNNLKMSSNQLFIDFKINEKTNFCEENFIIHNQNNEVFQFLEKFFSLQKINENVVNRLILKGEKSCGKTHLVNIFAKKFNAKIIDKNFLKDNFVNFFQENNFYILEDVDKINDENFLFHILNIIEENKAFLLMSAEKINVFKLKDLVSRIKNIPIIEIKNPEIEAMKMLFFNGFSKKQLKISSEIVDFICFNIKRNYSNIFEIIKRIEKFCFENKKNISVKDVANIIEDFK